MKNIIGRADEKIQLGNILQSGEPELVAIYGRRRVGKTFLVTNIFEKELVFELFGIHNASLQQQLENFSLAMEKATSKKGVIVPPKWLDAFSILQEYLVPIVKKQRAVIFIDEFPWLNTPRSGFLQAFESFWNTWASRQNNLVVVICGSAASWMINKVINNRGGLHNRVTRKIRLLPFTVGETAMFLKERKINLDHYQVLQLYMAMGGVPQYLREIRKGESAAQAIDRICFTKDGLLFDEFKNLYHSLFENASNHTNVIRALAKKGSGLTRTEIIDACKLTSGGGATQLLDELTESGFITPYIPFDRTAKDSIYKLTDEYSRFYIKFIESSRATGAGTWIKFSTGVSWKSWAGNAFEVICMKHTLQIKRALGIESVYTEISLWRYAPGKQGDGAQIDLLIDRQDRCINICEMKFSTTTFDITKAYAKDLENKLSIFRKRTNTKKTLFLTMMSTYGVKNNLHYAGLVQNNLSMEILFN